MGVWGLLSQEYTFQPKRHESAHAARYKKLMRDHEFFVAMERPVAPAPMTVANRMLKTLLAEYMYTYIYTYIYINVYDMNPCAKRLLAPRTELGLYSD